MSPEELAYYRERALIERRRASRAAIPLAANIHLELACFYEKLVELDECAAPMMRTVAIGYPDGFESAELPPFPGRQSFSMRKGPNVRR